MDMVRESYQILLAIDNHADFARNMQRYASDYADRKFTEGTPIRRDGHAPAENIGTAPAPARTVRPRTAAGGRGTPDPTGGIGSCLGLPPRPGSRPYNITSPESTSMGVNFFIIRKREGGWYAEHSDNVPANGEAEDISRIEGE